MAQGTTQRLPNLEQFVHPDVAQAIRQAFQLAYALQEQVKALQAQIAEMKKNG